MLRRFLDKFSRRNVSVVEHPIERPVTMGSSAANDLVRQQLHGLGDAGLLPRNVRHFAYPGFMGPTYTDPASVVQRRLEQAGYDVEPAEQNDGLRFSRRDAVAGAEFDAETMRLAGEIDEAGWHYDGWECEVVTQSDKGERQ